MLAVKTKYNMEAKTIKPQTVNKNIKAVRKIFSHITRKGIITHNPFDSLKGLPVYLNDINPCGCYDLDRLKGVFHKRWKNEVSYLLCALIYTTGMRNSEIRQIRLDEIQQMNGSRFISIKRSKTASGIRLVPVHGFYIIN
jgi:site-specific recombinase XerD